MRRVRDQKDKGHQGSAKTVSPKFPPGPGDEISQKMLDLARPSLREGVNLWGLVGKCEAVPGGVGNEPSRYDRVFDSKHKHGWHFSQPIRPRNKTMNLYSRDDIMM